MTFLGRHCSRIRWVLTVLFFAHSIAATHAEVPEPDRSPAPSATAVLATASTDRLATQPDSLPLSQRIDQILAADYRGPQIPLAGDLEFHRRVYLDLIGHSPTVQETQAYVTRLGSASDAAESERVRQEVIDDLLSRDAFERHYAKVLEVMVTERRADEKIGMLEFREFIRRWLAEKRPLNELCMEILAADGTGEKWRPAASFMLNRAAEPNLVTRDVGRIFFGRNLQCAQCHDHPLVSDYEQSEYFGILSFVARTHVFLDEKRGNLPFLGEKGEGQLEFTSVFRPEDGKSAAQPVLPMAMAMDAEPEFVDDADAYLAPPAKDQRAIPRYSRRQQLAVLATHPENQSFNRNLANRLWANLMGVGVVHPVDLHHLENPPISSALLRLLADELVASRYDLRAFVRQIARSHAYQRSRIPPNLDTWAGPAGGVAGLQAEGTRIDEELQQATSQQGMLDEEIQEANARLQRAQAEVARIRQEIDAEKQQWAMTNKAREAEVAKLNELQGKQKKQQELLTSLKGLLAEAEKVVKLLPEDQELAGSHKLLAARLATATEAAPALDSAVSEQQELVADSTQRADDQRGRVVALSNRRLALAEFVVEARGAQRRVRNRQLAAIDHQSDLKMRTLRLQELRDWLELRDKLHQASQDPSSPALVELQTNLKLAQSQLIESWRRGFALRMICGLSPEQFSVSVYYALELDQPIRNKVRAEWETAHQSNPEERNNTQKLQQKIDASVGEHQWGVEDSLVGRFASPPGTPQDGFFATTDQALMIQNDPTFQSWLKPDEGSLIHRLIAIQDTEKLAHELYLSILSRPPDSEESLKVVEFISRFPDERTSIIQELAWGLLASAEFRFLP